MKRQISAVRVCVRACVRALRVASLKMFVSAAAAKEGDGRDIRHQLYDTEERKRRRKKKEERRKKNNYPDYWVLNFFFLLSVCVSLGFRNKLTVYNDAYSVESIKVDGIVGPSMPTDRCVCVSVSVGARRQSKR